MFEHKTLLIAVLFACLTPHVQQHLAHGQQPEPERGLTTASNPAHPTERELVSVLKRNLPQDDQTVEIGDAPEWFQNFIQRIVRDNVPNKYVQEKDWGKTDQRWDGLKIRRKGPLGLTTKRRWKEVNHGKWKRYEISQINPNENLLMRIENVHDAGKGRVAFEVSLASKVHAHGRFAQWAKGVQLYNVSADADADIRMRLWCRVGTRLDVAKFPPDVILVPEVTRANMNVTEFQLQSVSKLDGPVVKQLGKSIHKVLVDKIEEKREQLPAKINRQIAKNEDKLRLSFADFAASRWKALTGDTKRDEPRGDASATSEKQSSPILANPANDSRNSARPVANTSSRVVVDPVGQPASLTTSQRNHELLDLTPPDSLSGAPPAANSTGLILNSPEN